MKLRFMTNEEYFEVSKQPEPTCPMIDSLIKRANEIMKTIAGYNRMNEDELLSAVDDVDTLIRYFEDELNGIRHHVEKIRSWGQEWKDVALDLSEQLDVCDEKND